MSDVVNCPQCERKLRVPEELLGKKVKCPTCGNTFTAEAGPAGAPPSPPPPPPAEEERPSRRPPSDEDVQEEDRPSRRGSRRDTRYDDEPRPRRRSSGSYAPHRGTLILVLGILSIVCMHILGPVAWILGNNDLKEIRAGRMDPEGESNTNIGRILGIVGTCLLGLGVVCGCAYIIFVVAIVGAGGAAAPHR
jgi:predicted Zn finger-like uncharacterized protein